MKTTTLIAATVATMIALPAVAGGLAEPVMEPKIIMETMPEASSSSSALLPIIIMAMIVAAASN